MQATFGATRRLLVNATLKLGPSQLVACFGWGGAHPPLPIPGTHLLAALEVLAHDGDLARAAASYAEIAASPAPAILDFVIDELDEMGFLAAIADCTFTLSGRPFSLTLQHDPTGRAFDLTGASVATRQVLRALLARWGFPDDLGVVDGAPAFARAASSLEALGLAAPAPGAVDFGDLRRLMPVCSQFGAGRGAPIDRYYLGQFIRAIRPLVTGRVLEIGGNRQHQEAYGFDGATEYLAMELAPGPGIDIAGDAHDRSIVAPASLDAVIAFNVLEHCAAPWVIAANMHAWLRPGGRAFVMVPSAQRLHAYPRDYWRILPDGMEQLFAMFARRQLHVYGNPLTTVAALHGIAVEELSAEELDRWHPDYPVATCVTAEK